MVAKLYSRVTFRGSNGLPMTGLLLAHRNGHVLVGVQNERQPRIRVRLWRKPDRTMRDAPLETTVPNNAIWAVPWDAVIETSMSER